MNAASTLYRPRASTMLISEQDVPRTAAEDSWHGLTLTLDEAPPLVMPFGEGEFVIRPRPDNWIVPALQKVSELGFLPPNWNSYGARPIRPEIAQVAIGLLLNVLLPGDPLPAVVPTARGGIMLEWHEAGVDLEIDIRSPNVIHVWLEYDGRSEEIEQASVQEIADRLNSLRSRTM